MSEDNALRPLVSADAVTVLRQLLPTLGRGDRPATTRLIQIFQEAGTDVVPLYLFLSSNWPGLDEANAGERFNHYQQRLNVHLARRASPVRLEYSNGREALAYKKVWLTKLETAVVQVARLLATGQELAQPSPTPGYYFPRQVTVNLPSSPWRMDLRRFAAQHGGEQWQRLDVEEQDFFTGLQVKFEPIVQLLPVVAGTLPVVGFEFLALGPTGESHQGIMQRAEQAGLDRGFVEILLAVAQALAAETLRHDALSGGAEGVPQLLFTLNIGPEMLDSPLFETLLPRLNKPYVLFELNEHHTQAERLARLQASHGLRYVLDDRNAWQDEATACQLAPQVEWTKIDFKGYQSARGAQVGDVEPKRVFKRLKRFKLLGKPLVVEGVASRDDIFLIQSWQEQQGRPLLIYGQGFGIETGSPWDRWLARLDDFAPGLHGWILATPFLARITRIVQASIGPGERMQRRMVGALFCFELQGEKKREQRLWLLPVRPGRRGDEPPERLFKKNDWLVLPTGKSVAFSSLVVPVTEERLPQLLRLWQEGTPLGEKVLRQAARAEPYPFDWYQEQWTGQNKVAAHPDPEGAEGVRVLMAWLVEQDTPFCALLGEGGIGKSFLCRVFVRAILAANKQHSAQLPVPFYLDLTEVQPTKRDQRLELGPLLEYMLRKGGFADTSAEVLLAAVQTGHVVLVFDGLDELVASTTRENVRHLLGQLWQAVPVGGHGKVLFSSSTHHLFNLDPGHTNTGGGSDPAPGGVRRVYVQPFATKRIHLYLEQHFPGQGEAKASLMQGIAHLVEWASRPVLLSLLADVLPELEARTKRGQWVGAAQLYQTIVVKWLERERRKHELHHRHKRLFMEVLARCLWEKGSRAMHHAKLWVCFMAWTAERIPDGVVVQDEGWIDPELRAAAFLVRDADGNYCFIHTSFQEYFLAQHLLEQMPHRGGHALDLPLLDPGTARLLLELAFGDAASQALLATVLRTILEGDYLAHVSANALRIFILWQQLDPTSVPSIRSAYARGVRTPPPGVWKQ